MHLAAACLPRRENHLVTEPLKQFHCRNGRLREQGIRETSGEQGNAHRNSDLGALSGCGVMWPGTLRRVIPQAIGDQVRLRSLLARQCCRHPTLPLSGICCPEDRAQRNLRDGY
jgi:hypothetical protein